MRQCFCGATPVAMAGCQIDEVVIKKGLGSGFSVGPDLSLVIARWNGKATQLAPTKVTDKGVPLYDLASAKTLVEGRSRFAVVGRRSIADRPRRLDDSHHSAAALFQLRHRRREGWKTGVELPEFVARPARVARSAGARPPRHAHWPHAARQRHHHPRGGEPLWAINTNHGPICLFTVDGLFVAQLFQDMRLGRRWQMPIAQRGMKLNELTPSDENFWPIRHAIARRRNFRERRTAEFDRPRRRDSKRSAVWGRSS